MADGVGVQAFQAGLDFLEECLVAPQDTAGSQGVLKEFADDGQVGSTTIACCAVVAFRGLVLVLWRGAGGGDQFAGLQWVVDEPVEAESTGPPEQGIGNVGEEIMVEGVAVVFPEGL